jgi:hypothetical protein
MNKNGCPVKKIYRQYAFALGIVVCFFAVIGCAPTRMYSVDMNYSAEKAVIPAFVKADPGRNTGTIAVAEFIDTRQVEDRLVIGRVTDKDGTKKLIMPRYIKPTQAVAAGVKEYLSKAGYKVVRNIGVWDLKEETMPQTENKVVLGGSIEELDLSCRKGFPTDTYKAKIKFSIILADAAKRKILYRSVVESDTSLERVSFSEENLEKQINSSLSQAIEKIFEDKNFVQKLKEIIKE